MKKNNRRDFITKAGVLSLGGLLPIGKKTFANNIPETTGGTCTLIPSETRGPYPLFEATAIASQTAFIRSNIKETQTGVPLALTITVQNLSCTPVPNAKVYIWHCTKAGLYSGYSTSSNAGQAGLTYLRGIQVTDSNGQVTFNTIYPGWYMGRLTHIHVEIYINDVLIRTSQIAFPLDSVSGSATQLVNAANGQSNNTITSYSGDNVFSDGYTSQLISLTGSVAAGYVGTHTFVLDYTVTPLKLISFTGGVENKSPMLWWTTENEVNVSHFEIEQSTHPSKNFELVGKLTANNSTSVNSYAFALKTPLPADISYYRLKIVDKDGSYEYSSVVTIHLETLKKMYLANTYVINQLIVKHPATYDNSIVKIISLNGQLIATGKLQTGTTQTTMDVTFITEGAYLLVIESGIDRLVTKFIKGH